MLEFAPFGGALDPEGNRSPIGDSAYALLEHKTKSILCVDCGAPNLSMREQALQSQLLTRFDSGYARTFFEEKKYLTRNISLLSAPLPQDTLVQGHFPNIGLVREFKQKYLCVTHAHADHIIAVPFFWRQYRDARIFMTQATFDIGCWVWSDYLKITRARLMQPLYHGSDVEKMKEAVVIIREGISFDAGPFLVRAYSAGHILGAVSFHVTERASQCSVYFSGDICVRHQHTVKGADLPSGPIDYVVTESTYGGTSEVSREEEARRFISDIRGCVEKDGKVIIPAFAIGRTAELFSLLRMNGISDLCPIYIDGGGRDLAAIYVKHGCVDPSILQYCIRSVQERQTVLSGRGPLVVISPSGMAMPDTLSADYILRFAEDERNLIAFPNYVDPCSQGSRILSANREDSIVINNEVITLRARVQKYVFSAHADGGELYGIIKALRPTCAFLTHGSSESMDLLRKRDPRKLHKSYINERYQL